MEFYSLGKSKINALKRYLKDYEEGKIKDEDIKKAYPEKEVKDVIAEWKDLYAQSSWMLGNCLTKGYLEDNNALDYFWYFKQMEDRDIPVVLKANHISSLQEMKAPIEDLKNYTKNPELLLYMEESLEVLEKKENLRKFFSLALEMKLATLDEKNYVLKVSLNKLDDFHSLLKQYLTNNHLKQLCFRWEINQD